MMIAKRRHCRLVESTIIFEVRMSTLFCALHLEDVKVEFGEATLDLREWALLLRIIAGLPSQIFD